MFRGSSQQQHWTFSADEIALRYAVADAAFGAAEDKTIVYSPANPPRIDPTTVSPLPDAEFWERESVLRYFCNLIKLQCDELCKRLRDRNAMGVSQRTTHTAMAYFRRFYLFNSIRAFDPRVISLACIFLAAKTEEERIEDVTLFIAGDRTEAQLVRHEEYVLQGLGFYLHLFHPRSVAQVVLEEFRAWKIAQLALSTDSTAEAEVEVKRTCDKFSEQILMFLLDDVMTTYLPLAATPADIALGALLHNATPALDVERFISDTLDAHAPADGTETCLQRAQRIKQALQLALQPVDDDRAKQVFQQLRKTAIWHQPKKRKADAAR